MTSICTFKIIIVIESVLITFFIGILLFRYNPLAIFTIPLTVLIISSIPFICILGIGLIFQTPDMIVKGTISKAEEGKIIYQCGECGEMGKLIYIEIEKNLYICSNCGEYNFIEDKRLLNNNEC